MKQGSATGADTKSDTGPDTNAVTIADTRVHAKQNHAVGGVAGWLLEKLQAGFQSGLRQRFGRTPRRAPRLTLVERISLAPRQQLALVEAEGRHLLVATSPDGAPTFYALEAEGQIIPGARSAGARSLSRAGKRIRPAGRVSW